MIKSIILPDIGEGIEEVEITEISIKVSDLIKIDDTILVVETEKASMEIPATLNGKILEIKVSSGETIHPGTEILVVDEIAHDEELTIKPTASQSIIPPIKTQIKIPENSEVQKELLSNSFPPQLSVNTKKLKKKIVSASPSVRRFARELGCELLWVSGSGHKGRITKEDVQSYIKVKLSHPTELPGYSPPEIDFSQFGEIETIPLSKIRKVTGKRLQFAWNQIPHVTQFDKADITELNNYRKKLNSSRDKKSPKMSFLPFIMKALISILKKYPDFNSSLELSGNNLIRKKYFHIGIAVDTENGLIVPVIQNVNDKSVDEIMVELTDISKRARSKKIKLSELTGSCFTISSLGGISGTGFTPIVNPPEVGILGISRTQTEPVYIENIFKPRVMLPISLSYDHRVIDGALAARFTKMFTTLISDYQSIPDLFN